MTSREYHPSDLVATEAADWYARLRAPDVSELERVRFRAWLASDPARRHEFEAIDSFWDKLEAIHDSPEVARVRTHLLARRRRIRDSRLRGTCAIAATLVLALTGSWFWSRWNADRYVTQIGQMRAVRLPDGSVATLNSGTELKVRYSQGRRGVELLRGEAHFDVAKDPSHPFLVMAGGGQVEALGTVFDVYTGSDKVTVTLVQGTVAVTPDSRAVPTTGGESSVRKAIEAGTADVVDSSVIVLTAGEQLSYPMTPSASTSSHARAASSRILRWRGSRLNFTNTPILEAIAEANRYSSEQIVLDAPQLTNARISGVFEAGRNDLFAEGLRAYFRLQVVHRGDHVIVLRLPPH